MPSASKDQGVKAHTCRPASQFCCGFSVETGVKIILTYHLLQNLWFISQAAGKMIFGYEHALGLSANRMYECIVAGFCLAGIPLILITYVGVAKRIEATVRLYFLYLTLCVAFDTAYCFRRFVLQSSCNYLPAELKLHGSAFACGVLRGTDTITIVSLCLIQGYLMFVVWSYCEDLAMGGSGTGLQELHLHKQHLQTKIIHEQDAYNRGIILAQQEVDDLVESGYGAIEESMSGFGGSERILGGRYHDMQYPPRAL